MFGVRKGEIKNKVKKLYEESQSNKEKSNRFICLACGEWRLRGVFVRANSGDNKGFIVKVCNSDLCRRLGAKGEYAVGAFKCD